MNTFNTNSDEMEQARRLAARLGQVAGARQPAQKSNHKAQQQTTPMRPIFLSRLQPDRPGEETERTSLERYPIDFRIEHFLAGQ
jgi:hypothetical protein